MIFKQLFEPNSSSYTYLLGCRDSGLAVLIDPVLETVERDQQVLQELGLKLAYSIETHIHADHLTGARKLKYQLGSKIAGPAMDDIPCRDIGLQEGETFRVGTMEIHPLLTPGHTATHHAYLLDNSVHQMLFSGDALLIDGCGRTDFQGGNPVTLYESIQRKLFTLPDETLVYPGHDYVGHQISTIGQEKTRNPRLGGGKTLDEFIEIMNALKLPYPRKMDFAVPGNLLCGECPPDVPEEFRGPCEVDYQG
ncbi:MAG: MBL fold metallo-hydrolase [Gammaproteobacteria bacterium]